MSESILTPTVELKGFTVSQRFQIFEAVGGEGKFIKIIENLTLNISGESSFLFHKI